MGRGEQSRKTRGDPGVMCVWFDNIGDSCRVVSDWFVKTGGGFGWPAPSLELLERE